MSARRQFAAWGNRLLPQRSYRTTQSVFLAALGLVYFCAFGSLATQVVGLYGARGIVPLANTLSSLRTNYGGSVVYAMPSLFWLGVSDQALQWICIAGCLSAVFLIIGWLPVVANLICWALYLSLASVGAPFTNFQWDALLLETGFLAIWAGSPLLVWAYRLLLFRLFFESGLVKIASGDLTWRTGSALQFHFYTQPLPNPLAYPAAHLPTIVLQGCTVLTLAIELIVPFLLFAPRPARLAGTGLLALLQIYILLTGNYGFFNLLTLALCLWGLDDAALQRLPWRGRGKPKPDVRPFLRRAWQTVATAMVLCVCSLGLLELTKANVFRQSRQRVGAFQLVNSYGLFASMTTARNEIVLQASNDAEHWQDYEFRFKPGDPTRSLPIAGPHMPRLDWQMWFAALGSYSDSPWFGGLMYRLLTGEPSVRALLATNKGPTQKPKYLRALSYTYQFSTAAERSRTGAIWIRELTGVWFGPVSLTGH